MVWIHGIHLGSENVRSNGVNSKVMEEKRKKPEKSAIVSIHMKVAIASSNRGVLIELAWSKISVRKSSPIPHSNI